MFSLEMKVPRSKRITSITELPGSNIERLVRAMGFDLGSIHAATDGAADAILADLRARPADWLRDASRAAARAVEDDWEEWKRR